MNQSSAPTFVFEMLVGDPWFFIWIRTRSVQPFLTFGKHARWHLHCATWPRCRKELIYFSSFPASSHHGWGDTCVKLGWRPDTLLAPASPFSSLFPLQVANNCRPGLAVVSLRPIPLPLIAYCGLVACLVQWKSILCCTIGFVTLPQSN